MSRNPERLKLILKKGSKLSNAPADSKKNLRDQVDLKKDRNMAFKGLKRRLSSEEEVCNKKTCPQAKIERVESGSKSTGSTPKDGKNLVVSNPRGGKNLATSRMARLRESLRDAQSEQKGLVKKTDNISYLRGHPEVTPKSDREGIVKKTINVTNHQNIAHQTKSDVKTTKFNNFRIPLYKSANDHLELFKEHDLQGQKTDNKTTVIIKSPGKKMVNFRRRGSDSVDEKLGSPIEKSHCMENAYNKKVSIEYKSKRSPQAKPETSFRLSSEYIVISEASGSYSAGSSKQSTPANHRLNSIKNRLSSTSSDKTLTPGSPSKPRSPVTPVSPNTEDTCFKTPVRRPSETGGLRLPLYRGLFKRSESAVQTKTNIFNTAKDEGLVSVPAEHSKSIFGAQVYPNIFHNYDLTTEKNDNVFASKMSRYNNNTIVSQINMEDNVHRSIFSAASSQKNIFSNFSNQIPVSTDDPTGSYPHTSLHNLNDTHQSVYPLEPKKSGIKTEKPRNLNPSLRSRKSANDRLTTIKSEGCNTYRKNQVSVPHETVEKHETCSQLMESERIMETSPEDLLSDTVRNQEFNGLLQRHYSLGKPRPCPKELLTQDWLDTHQRTTKDDMDTTMSDSMVANVDETILNKSELPDFVEDVSMEWDSVPQPSEVSPPTPPAPPTQTKKNIICVVTDTNIFMHSLHTIKDTINLKVPDSQKIQIYVPWMVLKELDHLKDHSGEPTRSIALRAQRFINKSLTDQDSKIIGQSVQEVSQQQNIGKSPDDKILSCSLQAKEKYETVILLTNDINLRNAASFNNIPTCTPQEILSRLKLATSKRSKFCKIRTKLVALWSEILCDCCKEAYGDAWKKMDMLQNPPWSMVECIKRFRKYWGSVFRVILLKHCQQPIDEIYNFLIKYKDGVEDDTDEFKEFTKLILGFMFFLLDLPNHKISIKRAVKEIDDIVEGR